ncbi:MAG: SDR family oxidoreductase [Rhodoferax sp.]
MARPPLVLITGASSGIGLALARAYARAGWRLALVVRKPEVLKNIVVAGSICAESYEIYSADVSDIAAMAALVTQCTQRQGVPDVVIANAGISVGVDTSRTEDLAVMAQVLATNVLGVAATLGPFSAPMVQRGSGTLVGIASVAGIRGLPGHGAYCASKAAVISYCESLRGELRNTGVKVVTLSPGYVATPLTSNNRYAMPFLMSPDDFAQQALHAIARQVSYQVIPWPMALVAKLLRVLPNAWFDRLLAGRPRKPRRADGR